MTTTDRTDGWECSFADARRRKLVPGLRATPAQRLCWLEESLRLAHASGVLERRRAADRRRDGNWDEHSE